MALMEKMLLTDSLKRCKEYLQRYRHRKVVCPCCNRVVQFNKVIINQSMVLALIDIHKATIHKGKDWVHVPTKLPHLQRMRSYPKLAYWGLIESRVRDDSGVRRAGQWRVTELGYDFLLSGGVVSKYVKIYNRMLAKQSGTKVTLAAVMGNKTETLQIPTFEDTNP